MSAATARPKSEEPQSTSRRTRIAIGLILLILVVGIVVLLNRNNSTFPRKDPNIGKQTDVVIEGTVTCNGQVLTAGYVVAWQGPPVAFGEVAPDGSYRIENAPLGACILTYSATPPLSTQQNDTGPLPKDLMPTPVDKEAPPKDGNAPKVPHDKDPAHKDKGPLTNKEDLQKKKKDFPGSRSGPPAAVRLQELPPEQRHLVETSSRKYNDPLNKPFDIVTKKGTNAKNLDLFIP